MTALRDEWLATTWLSFLHPAAIQAVLDDPVLVIVAQRCHCTARYPMFRAAVAPPVGGVDVLTQSDILRHLNLAPPGTTYAEVREQLAEHARQKAERALP